VSAVTDTGAEREIDLARWKQAAAERWWLVAAGVVAGIIVGALYSLSGGSIWQASVLMAPSQAFSPNGSPVLSYQSSPRAINELATDPATLKRVAAQAHVSFHELQGHVSTATVSTGQGSTASRGSVLIRITVQLKKPKETAAAADALGDIVAKQSTGQYVLASIATLKQDLVGNRKNLASVGQQIDAYNEVLRTQKLDPFDHLILVTNLNNAISRQGNLNDKIEAQTQQLTLAQNIELAQVISPTPSSAVKTTARSRRNSILVGALIGLIVGAIVAIVLGTRLRRGH
jgi:capsular polysaccharide biosynthesis protein